MTGWLLFKMVISSSWLIDKRQWNMHDRKVQREARYRILVTSSSVSWIEVILYQCARNCLGDYVVMEIAWSNYCLIHVVFCNYSLLTLPGIDVFVFCSRPIKTLSTRNNRLRSQYWLSQWVCVWNNLIA